MSAVEVLVTVAEPMRDQTGTQNSVKGKKRNREFLTVTIPDCGSEIGNRHPAAIVLPNRLKSRTGVFRLHL